MNQPDDGIPWFFPDWPAPANVRACVTVRYPGASLAPRDGFNLALHVGDQSRDVDANRALLETRLKLPVSPFWLEQTHSDRAVLWGSKAEADASYSFQPGEACVVLTADCLSLLVCDRAGSFVAAIHAGWRGLDKGIIENTLSCFPGENAELLVYLGPCIGQASYEIDASLHSQLLQGLEELGAAPLVAGACFKPSSRDGHYLTSLEQMARLRLQVLGVNAIYGGGMCTYSNPERFFSYRRDGNCTGRIASMVWLQPPVS